MIGKKVADLLDLHAMIEAADSHWFGGKKNESAEGITVMVAELASLFERVIPDGQLYRKVEAA